MATRLDLLHKNITVLPALHSNTLLHAVNSGRLAAPDRRYATVLH